MNEKRKIRVPDGKGGWKLEDAVGETTKVKLSDEKAQDRLQHAQEEDFFARVGACTEALNTFLKIYTNDHNLSHEEVMAAIYLENLNNREYYPEGAEKYDNICKDVHAWFQSNKS